MQETYQFKDGRLTIQDPDLGIDIDDVFDPLKVPKDLAKTSHLILKKSAQGSVLRAFFEIEGHFEGEYILYYPNGKVETRCFYKHGKLHGPSTVYSESGMRLSETWFYQDQKEGKAIHYHLNGKISSIVRHKKGVLHGMQEYYYNDGGLKSEMCYCDGVLEGAVNLYHPNGKKKREVFFQTGLREGYDRMWSANGALTDEGKYEMGDPVGVHRHYFENGAPFEERVYYAPSRYDTKKWDEKGTLYFEGKYDDSLKYVQRTWKDGEEEVKVGKWDGNKIKWESHGSN